MLSCILLRTSMSVEMTRIGHELLSFLFNVNLPEFSNRRLLRNAKPELDFKYFSKATAEFLDLKAPYHSIVNGALLAEYVTSLRLCLAKRAFRFWVEPM